MSNRAQSCAGCAPWAGQAGVSGVLVVLWVFRVASGYPAAARPRAPVRPLRGFPSRPAASASAGAQVGKPSPQGGFGGSGRPSLFWSFFSSVFVLFFARLPCPRGFRVPRFGWWSAPPAPFTIVNIQRFFNNRIYICKC